ncbi:tetratricopeptide repeat protein [Kiloniella sp.]|uniref:tetratricopeptide repeat protein n=1 Tax=Kiloniella sp. TaxID=1938587 RepID=UPI003B015467
MKKGAEATQSGKIPDALETYTKVINLDPNYAEGWNQRALTHYLMGNYESSLSDIRRTLSLEPRHFGAISGQGLIYLAQHKWALAKKAFNRALKIHPTMRGPRQNLLFLEKRDLEEEI